MGPARKGIDVIVVLNLLEQDTFGANTGREGERHTGLVSGLSLRKRGVVALEHPVAETYRMIRSAGNRENNLI